MGSKKKSPIAGAFLCEGWGRLTFTIAITWFTELYVQVGTIDPREVLIVQLITMYRVGSWVSFAEGFHQSQLANVQSLFATGFGILIMHPSSMIGTSG